MSASVRCMLYHNSDTDYIKKAPLTGGGCPRTFNLR